MYATKTRSAARNRATATYHQLTDMVATSGSMKAMGETLDRGMVLVVSLVWLEVEKLA